MLKRLRALSRLVSAHLSGRPLPLQERFDLLFQALPDPWHFRRSGFEQQRFMRILSALGGRRFKRALEFGCAEGIFTRHLAECCDHVVGLDISPVALERARTECAALGDRVSFLHHDLQAAPLDVPPFDLIVASEVLYFLETVPHIEAAADRLVAALQPGGWLLSSHMRLRRDDTSGHARTWSGYPRIGAATIHPVLKAHPQLKLVHEDVQPLYALCVLQK